MTCVGVFTQGCGSSSTIEDLSKLKSDADIESTGPQLNISYTDSNDFRMNVSYGASGNEKSSSVVGMDKVENVVFNVYNKNDVLLRQVVVNSITKSGIKNENGTVSIIATAFADYPKYSQGDINAPVYAEAYLRGKGVVVKRKANFPPLRLSSRSLVIDISGKPMVDEYRFTVKVTRVFEDPHGEFLTTTELQRLEIFDSNGGKVYSTDDGKFYPNMSQVEPTKVGEVKTHTLNVPMKNYKTKAVLPDGNYTVVFTIPCRPEPYIHKQIMQLTTLKP